MRGLKAILIAGVLAVGIGAAISQPASALGMVPSCWHQTIVMQCDRDTGECVSGYVGPAPFCWMPI